jgi:hypothetical protein
MRHPHAAALLLLAVACRPADQPPTPGSAPASPAQQADTSAPNAGHRGPARAVLVDSVPYANELTDGVLHRVAVHTATGVDTLDGILADAPPVVVGDSVVYGIRAGENLVVGLFAHDVRTGRTRRLPAPPDWIPFAVPRLSPDGRHLAYLAQSPTGQGSGVVATVPDGRVIYRGPPATLLETDASIDAVRWEDANRFEIRVDLTYQVGGTQRLRGTVDPLRVVVDTVRPAPR